RAVLHPRREQGNPLVVSAHTLAVINTADWLVDLGPDGGSGGGGASRVSFGANRVGRRRVVVRAEEEAAAPPPPPAAAQPADDSAGPVGFRPELSGERTPHTNPQAKGVYF
ncbi:hypothetical protein Q6330_26695, partial [Klebsiella pneumoniae]|uniref:hypothetical protein n=1 Tax=Klebsiella pneumoniae TaxID=573 RepID=UPI00272FA7F4